MVWNGSVRTSHGRTDKKEKLERKAKGIENADFMLKSVTVDTFGYVIPGTARGGHYTAYFTNERMRIYLIAQMTLEKIFESICFRMVLH